VLLELGVRRYDLAERLAGSARDQWARRARRWLPQLASDARWREFEHGEVAFRLQPDLKESTGGMRDLQALRYVSLARPDFADPDSVMVRGAHETLLAARVELHRATGNARNLLTLEVQADAAAAPGHATVEDFMTAVAAAGRTVGWMADETWAGVEHWAAPRGMRRRRPAATTLEAGVQLRHDRNEVRLTPEAAVRGDALLPLRVAVAAASRGTRIERDSLLRLGTEMAPLGDPWPAGARELFVELLACGRNAIPIIEALDQAGAVVKILPEWETCRSRLQRNDYHRFTVDRHLCETAAQAADMIAGGEVSVRRPDLLLVASLLHDIGDVLAPDNHSAVAAAILAPYVSPETEWVVRHHGLFQGSYYFHHLGGDRHARERYAESPHYERCIDFCASYDQNCFDPDYDDLPMEDFVPLLDEVFSLPPQYTA